MKQTLKLIIAIAACYVAATGSASASQPIIDEYILGRNKIVLDSASITDPHLDERVIVGNDTISVILPAKNYGRYDRGLFNWLIIPRGQWSLGLTASYGEYNTDDIEMLGILKDFDINVKIYSIRPSISYFFKSNQSIGLKFNFSRSFVDLNNMTFDFDDDLNFSLRDVSYYSQSYSTSINYRNYVGLGPEKRFAIFNEIDLEFGAGSTRFKRIFNDEPRDTRANTSKVALNFSPGVCVFIMDYVSFNVSFGVFGLHLTSEKQVTDGVEEGRRVSSGANFRFNIFNINFGMAVHI